MSDSHVNQEVNSNVNRNLRKNIKSKLEQVLDHMIEKHNKVLPVRLDLRFPEGYSHDGKNTDASYFFKRMSHHCDSRGIDISYVAVREQDTSPVPHYHCMVILDGNKIQSNRPVNPHIPALALFLSIAHAFQSLHFGGNHGPFYRTRTPSSY